MEAAHDVCIAASQGRKITNEHGDSDIEAVVAEIVTDGSDDNMQLVSTISLTEQKFNVACLHLL